MPSAGIGFTLNGARQDETVWLARHPTVVRANSTANILGLATMPLSPGTRLGPYEVTAKIGEGGMGEVYTARDTRLDRTVAIKVLSAGARRQ